MTTVVIGIGLSGAGKTTFLKEYALTHNFCFIEVDAVKSEYGLPYGVATSPFIWGVIHERLQQHIHRDKNVVLDTTFLSPDLHRSGFLNFLRKNGADKIHGLFFNTPEDIAWQRNLSRDKGSSREVFERGVNVLKENPPQNDEFDYYTVIDTKNF